MSKFIELTQNKFSIIDDDDFERVNQFKWFVRETENNEFYAVGRITNNSRFITQMHRFIINCNDNKLVVDHINHNKLDNRKINLRACTISQNSSNKRKYKNSSCQYIGVRLKRGKYEAAIEKNNKSYYLGIYESEIEAAIAYDNKAKELHGEFANLNFK